MEELLGVELGIADGTSETTTVGNVEGALLGTELGDLLGVVLGFTDGTPETELGDKDRLGLLLG